MRLGEVISKKQLEELGLDSKRSKKEVTVSVKKLGNLLLINLSSKIDKRDAALLLDLLKERMQFNSWRFVPIELRGRTKKFVFKLDNYELIEIE